MLDSWWFDFTCLIVISGGIGIVRFLIHSSKVEDTDYFIVSDPGDECEHIYKKHDKG